MKSVSVIIPNFNGEHLLEECLSALASAEISNIELSIIVVDNGSDDGSVDFINRQYPHISIIKNDKNLGFAEACNIGAIEASGDYLAFLNNDTKVEKNWLTSLLSGIDEEKNIVCTASKIVGWNENEIEFGGCEIYFCGYGFTRSSFKEKYQPLKHSSLIPFACGCSMLINRKIFIDCGMFDKDYFAFYEDVDLGWRLNIMGYKTLYCPDSIVHHKHHATAKKLSEGFLYFLWSRNTLVSVLKNYGNKLVSKVFTSAVLITLERFLYTADLRNKAIDLNMLEEAERYLDIQEGIGKSLTYIFENLDSILEKRDAVQKNRKISDKELSEKFELKIDFDDIVNAKVENTLSSHLINCFDFSDIFREGRVKEHLLETIDALKEKYRETRDRSVDLEHRNNFLEHRVGHLESREDELLEYNRSLLEEIEEIKNSNTFKILNRVRLLGSIFRKEK